MGTRKGDDSNGNRKAVTGTRKNGTERERSRRMNKTETRGVKVSGMKRK